MRLPGRGRTITDNYVPPLIKRTGFDMGDVIRIVSVGFGLAIVALFLLSHLVGS
jgi:hypothetical protein